MRSLSLLLAGSMMSAPLMAATVEVTIPRLSVAEYHRPYVAIWLEPAAGGAAETVALWYDVKATGAEPGTKWLSDLRTWWRRGGRSLSVPADGVTGATRAPGTHKVSLPGALKPGDYVLHVEAARETGGRELVRLPFGYPLKGAAPLAASGKSELGKITLGR